MDPSSILGASTMSYRNKERQRAFQKEWIAKNRAEWLAAHGPCAMCGSTENLEVDHIDPAQKVSHKVWSWAPERRATELAKCQVLCWACHRRKTVEHRRPSHGSNNRYTGGCRCADCRTAHAAVARKYRAA